MKKIIKKIVIKNIFLDHLYQLFSTFFYYHRIKNHPFGKRPNPNEDIYLKLFEIAKKDDFKEIAEYELNKGFKIDKIWIDDLALITQITIKNSELVYAHGRIIYSCLSNYISKIQDKINILETGTSKGFSSLCMAKALKDQNKNGTIHTIDILPKDKKIYWNNISDLEGKKNRKELLKNWSDIANQFIYYYEGFSKKILNNEINLNRINFAFLDGSHTYFDVKYEFKFVAKRQCKNDIIIIDDFNDQYPGLIKAVKELSNSFNYSLELISSLKNRTYAICTKN